jgi:thiol-disulfide isomerase/thioredoxin
MKKFLVIVFMLLATTFYGQIEATHFNAGWNDANGCKWFMDLEDCKTKGIVDIATNPDIAKKHKIAVVPTIIIFKDGEEVARFQADLSFKMEATKEEVQEEINNQLMSDF